MSESAKAVFLSYARDDAAAARRVAEALRSSGLEVWFDENELRGGDAWDQKIRNQIKTCALFVAIVSGNSEARREGYFRREWRQAVDRTQDMADGTPFLIPVAVDALPESSALVPEAFLRVQWTRLPADGAVPPAFVQRVALLLGGGDGPVGSGRIEPPVAGGGKVTPSIAVLPFANLSSDADNEYFAEGLAEELLNVLARIRGLRVAARTSSFSFKGQSADIRTIASRLGVATVLEGSVRKAGNRVRITAQLINATDGCHLWSETYNRELTDIFAVQDDITQSVVKELQAALLGGRDGAQAEVRAASRGRTTDPEAHRLVLLGRFFYQRRSPADMVTAIAHFQQAVERDPGYALGWSELAQAIYWQTAFGGSADPGAFAEGFGRAEVALRRSLAIEPELSEGLLVLAYITASCTRNLAGSAQAIRRALERAPGDANIIAAAVTLVLVNGHFEEAMALARRSLELDPLNPTGHGGIGRIYLCWGRPAEAEAEFRSALKLNPEARVRRYQVGLALLHQGRLDEAETFVATETRETFRTLGLGLVHWAQGRRAEADAMLTALTDKFGAVAAYQVAELHAYRGEADASFQWLERAYAIYDPGIQLAKVDTLLVSLHADPRWPELLRKLGLADGLSP